MPKPVRVIGGIVLCVVLIVGFVWFTFPIARAFIYVHLAQPAIRGGDVDRAYELTQKAWEAYPNRWATQYHYSLASINNGQYAQAIPLLLEVLDSERAQTDGWVRRNSLYYLSEAYLGTAQFTKAFATINVLLDEDVPNLTRYVLANTSRVLAGLFGLSDIPHNDDARRFLNYNKLYNAGQYSALVTVLEAAPPLILTSSCMLRP